MSHIYTEHVTVRYDELDAFGRAHASTYLRYLAEAAVHASTAAGFGPEWYEANGLSWIVRRTTCELTRPVGRETPLVVRTWVEDFRRVRSHRAYEARDEAGDVVLSARTDWVLVNSESGRPARVPAEVQEAFGVPTGTQATPRPAWIAPAPPADPPRVQHAVRFADLDSLAHVNNATYLDLLVEGTLAVMAGSGWPIGRFREAGIVPWVQAVDIEYLDEAVYGDALVSTTWLDGSDGDVVVCQMLARLDGATPVARARTRWGFHALGSPQPTAVPWELADALAPLRAA